MPGPFTHIYTARRVAELLASGQFTDGPDIGPGNEAVQHFDPVHCGQLMQKWEKFTAVGAIGPDLFFFSEDWSNDILGPRSDDIMLALAVYFYFDAAKEDHPHPQIYQGDAYQALIDQGRLTNVVRSVTGHGLDRPFQELLDGIAPPPPFAVPKGFPLPWEVATAPSSCSADVTPHHGACSARPGVASGHERTTAGGGDSGLSDRPAEVLGQHAGGGLDRAGVHDLVAVGAQRGQAQQGRLR